MNVLVTGGTGTLGRHVVTRLRQSGHRARILSRQPRGHVDAVQGDLSTGAGIERAVAGMDAIVHAATGARQSLRSRGDLKGTERLIDAAHEARIEHIVYISMVGIDQVPYPYYRTKLMVELLLRKNRVPWSILRATHFHNLMEVFLRGFSRVPGVTAIPFGWQFQPVEADEVAARAVDAVLGEPCGMLEDFGGPEIRDFKSIAEAWLNARKEHRVLMNLPLPLPFHRQFAEGRLLTPDHRQGRITFDEYLAERYPLS
jgi:uncharacterized protein YbjT (DUF2867 family)